MATGTEIVSVTARQVYSDRGHPGVEATVTTENGGRGRAICTAGVSVGTHEVQFAYDAGPRWRGKGVQRAVDNVNNVLSFELLGMDASNQLEIDETLLNAGGPGAKARLGGNAVAAVSAATLKAGAAALGIPLYQHIGGVTAFSLPVCGAIALVGGDRYGGGARSGGKPSHSFMAYDFPTFSDASYAVWDVSQEWVETLNSKFGLPKVSVTRYPVVPAGYVKHDCEIWEAMAETIRTCGYEGQMGIQVDIAADTYYEADTGTFEGLFSA
jgi:enolase